MRNDGFALAMGMLAQDRYQDLIVVCHTRPLYGNRDQILSH